MSEAARQTHPGPVDLPPIQIYGPGAHNFSHFELITVSIRTE